MRGMAQVISATFPLLAPNHLAKFYKDLYVPISVTCITNFRTIDRCPCPLTSTAASTVARWHALEYPPWQQVAFGMESCYTRYRLPPQGGFVGFMRCRIVCGEGLRHGRVPRFQTPTEQASITRALAHAELPLQTLGAEKTW